MRLYSFTQANVSFDKFSLGKRCGFAIDAEDDLDVHHACEVIVDNIGMNKIKLEFLGLRYGSKDAALDRNMIAPIKLAELAKKR